MMENTETLKGRNAEDTPLLSPRERGERKIPGGSKDHASAVAEWKAALPEITVLEGDCRELLKLIPDGAVDLVIGDPPYGIEYQSNRLPKGKQFPKITGDCFRVAMDLLQTLAPELRRVMGTDAHCYIFSDWKYYQDVKMRFINDLDFRDLLIWAKPRGTGDRTGSSYVNSYEMILFLTKGHRLLNGHPANLINVSRPLAKRHPTQKDVSGLETLIENSSQPGEVVLDFVAGAGSTGVAARLCDSGPRKVILMELDAEHAAICRQRLSSYGKVAGELPWV